MRQCKFNSSWIIKGQDAPQQISRLAIDAQALFLTELNEAESTVRHWYWRAGLWTRELATLLGVSVPLYSYEHYYVVTEPLIAARADLPMLRDTDGHNYVKEDAGKWLVGSFEPQGKLLDLSKIPADVPFIELPEDWDQFELPFTRAADLLSDLENIGIASYLSGPESFTTDLLFLLGEVSGMSNLFVSAGYNSE